VTLDENDNDPSRFWTYVCSALRTFDAAVGKSTLSTLTSTQPPSFQTLLTPLINDLARLKGHSVLILEDYHVIKSTEIHEGVSFVIQHLPESLHLVLITRTDPDLPLAILRVRDEMIEINAGDLRFNQEETEAFLRATVQADFPSSTVTALLQKTGGWTAGLRLAVRSMQNKKNIADIENLIQSFSGSDRFVADYLIREVFDSQTEDIQSFLIKTCFFRQLTGSLCDAITGRNGGATTLEQLKRDNLFIEQLEYGSGKIWYHYNSLFAESIQYLARQRLDETSVSNLFERASGWYEHHGQYDEAIETALSAKLFERALTLIEKFIEIHDLSEIQTLSRWLENIPRQNIFLHPTICFTYAQIILYTTDRFAPATAARIEPFLSTAEAIWRRDEDRPRLGQLLSFCGNVVWWQGDFQKAFEYARQSLDELPEHDVSWRGTSLLILSYEALNGGRILDAQDLILEARALLGAAQNIFGVLAAIQLLSEVFYWQGELEQAGQLNQQILTEAVGDESMLDDQGIASLSLAYIACERNELEQAVQFTTRAFDLGEQRGNEILQVQATIHLAHIHSAKGDLSRARELLKSLEAKIQNTTLLREIQNAQALLSIRANDISALDWWEKIISVETQNVLHVQKEHEMLTLARLRIAEGKTNQAFDILRNWKVDPLRTGPKSGRGVASRSINTSCGFKFVESC
jgi:LuxR family maltose regulon positive regulatory protein